MTQSKRFVNGFGVLFFILFFSECIVGNLNCKIREWQSGTSSSKTVAYITKKNLNLNECLVQNGSYWQDGKESMLARSIAEEHGSYCFSWFQFPLESYWRAFLFSRNPLQKYSAISNVFSRFQTQDTFLSVTMCACRVTSHAIKFRLNY